MERITFKSTLSLGDHIVLLQAIESLHLQFPKKYITAFDIPQKELLLHHPAISPKVTDGKIVECHYPLVHKSNQKSNSFVDGYIDYIGEQLEIPLKLQNNHAHLYLTENEKKKYKDLGKYWIIVSTHKNDFTTKALSRVYLQEVVDHFIGKIKFIQPIKKNDPNTVNHPLKNVKMIGDLNIRDMLSLVYGCEGVVCQVTSWQHMAGAFEKPCICIGGNREPAAWVMQYANQHYLHSAGSKLSCCEKKACWRSRVIPLKDGSKQDGSLCENPCFFGEQWLAQCILQIRPSTIIDTIERII